MISEANESAAQIDTDDLNIHACPRCRGMLRAIGRRLECRGCGRIYNIRDDIPDFLLADPAKDAHPVLRRVRVIDWLAPIYETRLWYPNVLGLVAGKGSMSLSQLTAMIQEIIAPVAGYVLDVACGPGTLGRRVANNSRRVYGIDISTGMLKRGLILARREHVANIRFARAQVEALPVGNETFDAVICSGSLHLFADTVLALREIGRTLKSGSPLAIVTVTRGPAGLLRFRRIINYGLRRGLRVFEVSALEQMLHEAGFENFRSTTHGSLLTVRAQKW
jgi:SAM-dependent methyltransferase